MSAGCTLLSFQRPLRLFTAGFAAPSRMGQAGACPEGPRSIALDGRRLCLGGSREAAESAAFPPAGPCRRARPGRCRGRPPARVSPSSLTPPCLSRRRRLARADPEGVGHQHREVDEDAVLAGVGRQVEVLDLLGRLAAHEEPVEVLLGGARRRRRRGSARRSAGRAPAWPRSARRPPAAPRRAAAGSTRASPRRGPASGGRTSPPAGRSRRRSCRATCSSSGRRRSRPGSASSGSTAAACRRRTGCRGRRAG